MRLLATVMAALVLAVGGVALGVWWAPFVIGAALGIFEPPARITIPAGGLIGLLAWSLPLVVAELRFGLGPPAHSLAAIMGFTQHPELPVVLTFVTGLLLGLTGAWLGSAARALIPCPHRGAIS